MGATHSGCQLFPQKKYDFVACHRRFLLAWRGLSRFKRAVSSQKAASFAAYERLE